MLSLHDAKYNILKFWLSILVVAIHAQLYPSVFFPWLRMAVPLYFMMSAYFFFSQLGNKEMSNQLPLLKKFIGRNLRLYAFWFVVLLPLTLIKRNELYFADSIAAAIANFFQSLFFGSTFIASWYITASIIGMSVIFALSRKCKESIVFMFSLLSFSFVTFCSSYKVFFRSNNLLYQFLDWYHMIFGSPVCSFPASFLWIYLGKCFAENKIKISFSVNWIIFVISCIALWMEWNCIRQLRGSYNNDSFFMLFPACVSFFSLFQRIKPFSSSFSDHLKRASTVIYCLHGSIVPVVALGYRKCFTFNSNWLVFLTTFFGCIAVYICIVYMCRKYDNKLTRILRYAY